ncbi:MAG: acyl-CoA dehydrogenase C-terminal domain-containing protein, partial [Burkholderiaceae bacterium]|nr:acyl-CoA dehydrogenase C-terminal domain-containing protein [Burkholderiaceae bacterium]
TQAAWASGEPAQALANAVPYMQAAGHVVIAWIWLELQLAADASKNEAHLAGVAGAGGYFYRYELPKIDAWLRVVENRDMTCAAMPEEAF